MAVHIILKEYSNNVAVIEEVFSSSVKAQAFLAEVEKMEARVNAIREEGYRFMGNYGNVSYVSYTPADGNTKNTIRYYLVSAAVE